MDADDYCDMMLPEDDENDMTRIEQIKALCRVVKANSVSIKLPSVDMIAVEVPELLELVQEMAGALETLHRCGQKQGFNDSYEPQMAASNKALAAYKAFNEVV